MRTKPSHLVERGRVRLRGLPDMTGENNGFAYVFCPVTQVTLQIIFSDGSGYREAGYPEPAFEHVSVSVGGKGQKQARCPTWEEMAWVKGLFWGPEETVVQYHPPESEYVNNHAYVLHLWKPVGVTLPLPHSDAVGIKGGPDLTREPDGSPVREAARLAAGLPPERSESVRAAVARDVDAFLGELKGARRG